MTQERWEIIEALEPFCRRLEAVVEAEQSISLEWCQCAVLWSYLAPAVELLKADNSQNVSSADGAEERPVIEGAASPSEPLTPETETT